MSNGDAQVKACVLCYHTTPITGTGSAQLSYPPDLLVPIWQL